MSPVTKLVCIGSYTKKKYLNLMQAKFQKLTRKLISQQVRFTLFVNERKEKKNSNGLKTGEVYTSVLYSIQITETVLKIA